MEWLSNLKVIHGLASGGFALPGGIWVGSVVVRKVSLVSSAEQS